MKILYIHAKEFSYKPIERVRISKIEETTSQEKRFENVLVIFLTVEKDDFQRKNDILIKFLEDLKQHLNRLNLNSLVVYPYAHLSEELEEPIKAVRLLKLLDKKIKEELKDAEYNRAPFGWYKEFMIHCLGHPLSELSRRF